MSSIILSAHVRIIDMSKKVLSSYAALGVGLAVVMVFGLAALSMVVEQPLQDQFPAAESDLSQFSPSAPELPEPSELGVTPPAKKEEEASDIQEEESVKGKVGSESIGVMIASTENKQTVEAQFTITIDQCPGASNPSNDCFAPAEVTINVGDTVIWTNSDSASHTVTSGDVNDPDTWSEFFDSGLMQPGSTFEYTFDTAGEYPYLCQLHPWAFGKVVATEAMK